MRRRRYLQTTALALAGGLAGCNEFGASGDDPASAETAEPTATPTETAEPTPRDDPRDVEAPLYMDLLPRPHLKGTGGAYSDNAVFTKVDWKWYFQNRETVPKFGPTSNENWSFRPSQGNFQRAPSANVLKPPFTAPSLPSTLPSTSFSTPSRISARSWNGSVGCRPRRASGRTPASSTRSQLLQTERDVLYRRRY
ncbi:hypothetical protein BRD07_06450 [Halobacteriales archaeon QS_9_68_42]|nr:MAG: hypothetical protein BRD07_06450 [Halobacteriales archaeon QS_9_68_42]